MKRYLLFILLIACFVGCQKTESYPNDTMNLDTSFASIKEHEEYMDNVPDAIIGEKTPNPYSIDNIKAAFNNLPEATKAGFSESDIIATHTYIAFTPSNEDELYAIKAIKDDEMVLYHYPQDYEISDGRIVKDPRFTKNGYSYKWAYVPKGYDLSKINCPYEVLYDVYSPDIESPDSKGGQKSLPYNLRLALEKESYRLCGQTMTSVPLTKAAVAPSGYVKFWDIDFSSYRGVNGFKVRAVRGLHSCFMNTDANGYFSTTDTFLYNFKYEFYFRRTDFEIRDGDDDDEIIYTFNDYHGPIYKYFSDDKMCFWASIDRAAIVYYYLDNKGLRRPPMESDNTARLAIRAYCESGDAYGYFTYEDYWIFGNRPIVKVYRDTGGSVPTRRTNEEIFATTIHELAHASHWRNNSTSFYQTENIAVESFARGVQWLLTSDSYPGYTVNYYARMSYTGIIQDLTDGYGTKTSNLYAYWDSNGSLSFHTYSKSYYDNVSGYTPSQIEEALRQSTTWTQWRINLVQNNPGVANELDVVAAFDFWNSMY
ncbi:MAG: hypothetical protein IKZ51_08635 [Bacteroidales bacterium]|nr:hypothetical protein [Bacteroidales bacterium]